jgi:hypothetical protein
MSDKKRNLPFQAKISLLALFCCMVSLPQTAFALPANTTPSTFKVPASSLQLPQTAGYQYLGHARGQGAIQNSMVGPGQSTSHQLYYITYTYINGTMDLVTIDPNTGHNEVYSSPVSSEEAAWALTVGPDHNMYLGTLPNAHLLKFDTEQGKLLDLGQVPRDPRSGAAQSYIWQVTSSPYNNKMYGCSYPSADLVSYDPLDPYPQLLNLGSMDPTHQEQYARFCIADPDPNSPYIYVGLGSVSSQVIAYNVATNSITPLITTSSAGIAWVYMGMDSTVHAEVCGTSPCHYYKLSNGGDTQINSYVPPAPTNILNDGGTISVSNTQITVTHPGKSSSIFPYMYAGRNLSIFRFAAGPDGKVYGGTVLPYDFFSFNPANPAAGVMMNGQIGNGEPYAQLTYNKLFYIASYTSPSLEIYDPAQPFNGTTNPALISSNNFQSDLRPEAMIGAANNHLYIGAIASYGKLTGPLVIWNTLNNNDIQEYFPIQNQGIVSLTTTKGNCLNSSGNYCVIGGTTIYGGGGTNPSTSSAQLFSWDVTTSMVVHRYFIPAVSNPNTITDLLVNPANGYVYGIATNSSGNYLFIFNPATGTFINQGSKLPFSGPIYNSAAIYNGKIWGLSSQGVFSINLQNTSQVILALSSVTITAGFAMIGATIYFASGSNLYSYTTP